jgi:hypothetical protein
VSEASSSFGEDGAGAEVRTRLAVWEDRDALIALVHAFRAEETQRGGAAAEEESFWEDAASVVESHLTSSHRFYLIAEADGVPVGFVRFTVSAQGIEIGEQYVVMAYRRLKVGEVLLERVSRGLHAE